MKEKAPLSRIIVAAMLAVVAIALFTLLAFWTLSIARDRQEEAFSTRLGEVAAQGGERAVLSLAGYDVDNIFHGDEGLILFEEGSRHWLYSADEMQNISAYESASPSVVEVYASSSIPSASGCGVVVSSDGYIVTNTHVVGSGDGLVVRLIDGSVHDATLVGSDPITDIAVVKVDSDGLVPLPLSSAEGLVVGQKVIAIGSPYGYSWSQSVGTVSALERTVTSSSGITLSGLIQTDASINPGNSGGPLLNARGEMVGLVSAIYSTSGGAQGLGFAIPVDTVVDVASSLIRTGRVSRGTLDLTSVELNPSIVDYAGLSVDEGILVSQVLPGGQAEKAGIRGGSVRTQYGSSTIFLGGDVIVALDDVPITGYEDYYAFMAASSAGQEVDVTVVRNGSRTTVRDVRLVEQTAENMRWLIR